MLTESKKVIVTGAGGLVGQNLLPLLEKSGRFKTIGIEKDKYKCNLLQINAAGSSIIEADLYHEGQWQAEFEGCDTVIMLQAQINGNSYSEFERNSVQTTRNILVSMNKYGIQNLILIGSIAVLSEFEDYYIRGKREQERLVTGSKLVYTVLRPTLLFGKYDPKHLGKISSYLKKWPLFPVPGDGKYPRQPLFVKDLCQIILKCIEKGASNRIINICGRQQITYIEIINRIKKIKGLRTHLLNIPVRLFKILLNIYLFIFRNAPFTAQQLRALTAGDIYEGADIEEEFGFSLTDLDIAMKETYGHTP